MEINILGNEWSITFENPQTNKFLKENDGYADASSKSIVIANERENSDFDDFKSYQKKVMRHEIIHAFMYESGIGCNYVHPRYGHDETMVDWLAIQFSKIKEAFEKVGCL